ncbi:MAG: aminotransferase class V-fold PLP-dependent enzyme [Pseudomonadota bacterium]
MLKVDTMNRFARSLPDTGRPQNEILRELEEVQRGDHDDVGIREGQFSIWSQAPRAVANPGEMAAYQQTCLQAANMFFWDSQGFIHRQKSQIKFKDDLTRQVADLLDAPQDSYGAVTIGGTESNMLAVFAAMRWADASGRFEKPYEFIAPHTIHFSFPKAAAYFGCKLVKAPLAADYRSTAEELERLVTPRTIMIAGSAPEYCYGLTDDLEGFDAIARRHGLWYHIDACVGGAIGKIANSIDPSFEYASFKLPGLCSASTDLHKHTHGPMGTSVLTFRNQDLGDHSVYRYDDWPCGAFEAPTMNGGRPANVLAGAWALFQHLGEDGLRDLVHRTLRRRDQFLEGVRSVPGLFLIGDPRLTIFAFGSEDCDIFAVDDKLAERGWVLDRVKEPDGIHCNIDAFEDDALIPEFFADVSRAVDEVKSSGLVRKSGLVSYG